MNFKADWSFLEKISMGAVSSRAVIEELNRSGHYVIELERYSTSNKIWMTKIKRLRLPDLICLECGKRFESRAKTKLEVKMSDNENNPDRRWDAGLRNEDVIALIRCRKDGDGWVPSDNINLFEAGSLRQAVGKSKLGAPKSAYEGAERDRQWPSVVPKKDGKVLEVLDGDKLQIRVQYDDGNSYTYSYARTKGYHPYCCAGDAFKANETVIAGVLDRKIGIQCNNIGYDFLTDLSSELPEIRYAGVKALGYLERRQENVDALFGLLDEETDKRISLEIYSSLIRLGEDLWNDFYNYAMSIDKDEYKMEFSLILGEFYDSQEATNLLCNLVEEHCLEPEIKAAAIWGMDVNSETLPRLISLSQNSDPLLATHAIAHIEDRMNGSLTNILLSLLTDDKCGGIILRILTESSEICWDDVIKRYLATKDLCMRKWLLLIIGLSGRDKSSAYLSMLKTNNRDDFFFLEYLWDYRESSLRQDLNVAIDFLKNQCL